MKEVIVVGAGASGVAAAVSCGRNIGGENVLLLEKNDRILKKINATGNGKCNITNSNGREFTRVKSFLESLGLTIIPEDEGRMYPMSKRAEDVVSAFNREIKNLNIALHLNENVLSVVKKDGYFIVETNSNTYEGKKLVLALGGKAGSRYGSTGDGYGIAKQFGHEVKKQVPVLTGIECTQDFSRLKGIRVQGDVSIFRKGQLLDKESGEIQFTEYGLSGICIFNLSRHLLIDEGTAMADYEIVADMSQGMDIYEILSKKSCIPGVNKENILLSIFPRALAKRLLLSSMMSEDDKFTEEDIKKLADTISSYRFNVKGARGWKMAQCTKGGVSLDELNLETMESKIEEGLYFVGELIDYDGICGGYNLNNAWLTGIKAGEDVSNK